MILESVLALGLMGGANYGDYRTTKAALRDCSGCYEGNPLIGKRGERLEVVKAVSLATEEFVFVKLRKKHKKTAWAVAGVVIGVNLAVAAHNRHAGRN